MLEALIAAVERSVGLYLAVLPPMLLGCMAGSFMASSKAGARCAELFSPLARIAGLDRVYAPYLALCFLNFNSANAYLATLVQAGKARESRLLGVYLVGWLPASCHYYVFYFTPVLVPGLGLKVAGTVLGLYVMASLLICAIGAALNRKLEHPSAAPVRSARSEPVQWPDWPGWPTVMRQGAEQFFGIAAVFVPCILAIEILSSLPPARTLTETIQAGATWIGAPPASVLVVMAALPSAVAGFATAIACLSDGVLNPAQLPSLLMAAAVGHALFSAFSHFLPANVAVFGPKTGTKLTFTSLFVRLPCLLAALAAAFLMQ